MRLLITGATGLLGRPLVSAAKSAGHEVIALSRSTDTGVAEIADATILCDLLELEPDELPMNLDAIVHLAIAQRGSAEHILDVSGAGTRRLLEAAIERHARRFVHVSSMSVYPGLLRQDPSGAEGFALEPNSELRGGYARSKVLAEEVVRTFALSRDELELTILRPGLVFTSDMGDPLAGVAVSLPFGLLVGLGSPHQGVPVLDSNDFNRAVLALLEAPPRPGAVQVFDLLSGEPPRKHEFLELYRELSGQPARAIWIPTLLAVGGAWLVDRLRRSDGVMEHSVRRMYTFDPRRLAYRKLWAAVGERPCADARTALRSALSIDRSPSPAGDGRIALGDRARELLAVAEDTAASSNAKPHDLVLVGAGYVVHDLHLPALAKLSGYIARAVVDPNRAMAEAVAARVGANAFGAIAELGDELLQGATAVLATPGFTHYDLGCELIERGAHLLVEKPVALEQRQLDELRLLAAGRQRTVTVIHNYRLRPSVLMLWRFLLEHDVGALLRARVIFRAPRLALEHARWTQEEKRHRSLVFEMAIHFIDLACILGGRLESLDHVSVTDRADGRATLALAGEGRLERCPAFALDLDLSGSTRSVKLELEFERCACALSFYPDSFRVLPRDGNPIDDAVASLGRLQEAVRQRFSPRDRRAWLRSRPHRALYVEHRRRAADHTPDGPFSLEGVSDTMMTLFGISDAVYGRSSRERVKRNLSLEETAVERA